MSSVCTTVLPFIDLFCNIFLKARRSSAFEIVMTDAANAVVSFKYSQAETLFCPVTVSAAAHCCIILCPLSPTGITVSNIENNNVVTTALFLRFITFSLLTDTFILTAFSLLS